MRLVPMLLKKFFAALKLLSGAADGHSGWSLAESRIAEPSENPADSVTQEAYDSVMGDRAASHRAGSPARPQLPPRQPENDRSSSTYASPGISNGGTYATGQGIKDAKLWETVLPAI